MRTPLELDFNSIKTSKNNFSEIHITRTTPYDSLPVHYSVLTLFFYFFWSNIYSLATNTHTNLFQLFFRLKNTAGRKWPIVKLKTATSSFLWVYYIFLLISSGTTTRLVLPSLNCKECMDCQLWIELACLMSNFCPIGGYIVNVGALKVGQYTNHESVARRVRPVVKRSGRIK